MTIIPTELNMEFSKGTPTNQTKIHFYIFLLSNPLELGIGTPAEPTAEEFTVPDIYIDPGNH